MIFMILLGMVSVITVVGGGDTSELKAKNRYALAEQIEREQQ